MGIFQVRGKLAAISSPRTFVTVSKWLVDTGSEFSWVPRRLLKKAGVVVTKKDVPFMMANGETITRQVGYAILCTKGFETVDEVVFGEAGDPTLLGARTLEGFGASVDAGRKRLLATGPHPAAA